MVKKRDSGGFKPARVAIDFSAYRRDAVYQCREGEKVILQVQARNEINHALERGWVDS